MWHVIEAIEYRCSHSTTRIYTTADYPVGIICKQHDRKVCVCIQSAIDKSERSENFIILKKIHGVSFLVFQQIKYLHIRKELLKLAEHSVSGCHAQQEQLICVCIPVPLVFPTDVLTFPTKIVEVEHLIRVSNTLERKKSKSK